MKTFEFEKKGHKFEVVVEGENCTVKSEGVVAEAWPNDHPKGGWNYRIENQDFIKKMMSKKMDYIYLTHMTAEDAAMEIRKAKEVKLDVIREQELVFKVETAVLDRDWGITKPVLVEQKEYLSDEQRKQVDELERLLGTCSICLGGTKHIKARELPVEAGEEYTLSEIMEMVKKTDEYQRKAAKEQARQKELQEAEEEARETGKDVQVDRYTVPCNDPREECNTDIITVYVTPEGKTRTTRSHTW